MKCGDQITFIHSFGENLVKPAENAEEKPSLIKAENTSINFKINWLIP